MRVGSYPLCPVMKGPDRGVDVYPRVKGIGESGSL